MRIPECLADEICQKKNADCEVCISITVDNWRKHVKKILKKANRNQIPN